MPLSCKGGILGGHKSTSTWTSGIADVLFGSNLIPQEALSSGFSVVSWLSQKQARLTQPAPRTTLGRLQLAKGCFGLSNRPNITAEQKLCRDPL
ncbi:hypothetical protein COCC4DRAFT_33432 [Bipolaris maydis ATCC 48331]|uniref:Uncharacterized protein n=2 Tax=Cochliobolus heterostrophus TaxID=5016 RepID=M2U074_COCH5|nr:uncharacterized protein COCC4DRAFT_33432 [Bipolaris maydis ATCC 48331]EMD91934.1 hypothetical protein COCHEDRAFT_1020979 [Bipolaris maydis C5]ENI02582.1 hypothetical protein COCC4DRAFT_33432 [Bipolaris maydis ATCC 48331]